MSPTLYRNTGYTLFQLIEDIKSGRVALPDIQRPFVWPSVKARDLFDSMYRGYPIGTLMFWETGAEVGSRQIGLTDAERAPQLLIVDGQQRLTSLFAVLTGRSVITKGFEEKRIRIAFRPEDQAFEVTDAAIEQDPQFIPDITALWTDGYRATARNFLRRLRDAGKVQLTEAEEDSLEDRINRVHDLRDFPFQVVELAAGAGGEQVAEIFVRINSQGVKLNQADFILTLMSVHWEKGRRDLEEFSRASVDPSVRGAGPRNPFIDPSPDQMLRVAVAFAFRRARLQYVYNILQGKDLESGAVGAERRDEQFGRLAAAQERALDLGNWFEFLKCLKSAGFRSKKMITSENALLFSYALWLIGRFDFGLDLQSLRPVIARWFFMAHTTGRYTSSPESQLESDLGRIAGLAPSDGSAFVAELDRIVRANFTNDYWEISLPNKLDTSASRSPALFAYLATLDLLDAEALLSTVRVRDLLDPGYTPPRAIERWHLFPRRHLERSGVAGAKLVNAIANMAFIDWPDGRAIRDAAPTDYWPRLTANLPPEQLVRQTKLHALPIGWEQLDYQSFLERRRALIAAVVRKGFATLWGERTVPQPLTAAELIEAGESQTVEFKSTGFLNMQTRELDPQRQYVIVKTVCGLLNAEGGSLFIGVHDSGSPLGIADDMAVLGTAPNPDKYELRLREMIELNLSATTAATVRISFPQVKGTMVCQIHVAAAARSVFVTPTQKLGGRGGSEFWVRRGNATVQLHGEDMERYKEEHWG
ncbi:DUF262 domain-containing protein [Nocardia sp. NPDC057440]|uniref:GmrSD restriction endonuclease domain-containing protein n=1 Tax=Nocardia sp. NPDC057440 TaxID=3346134 RepID=UPI003671C06B